MPFAVIKMNAQKNREAVRMKHSSANNKNKIYHIILVYSVLIYICVCIRAIIMI